MTGGVESRDLEERRMERQRKHVREGRVEVLRKLGAGGSINGLVDLGRWIIKSQNSMGREREIVISAHGLWETL